MNMICVDDEPLAVEYTLKQCGQLPEIDRAEGFTDAESALTYLRAHSADIVLLDINMPDIDGITLAAQIKQLHPQTAILFLTAYKQYAFDAYAVHPAGYLLKPVSLEKLAEEVAYIHGPGTARLSHIHVNKRWVLRRIRGRQAHQAQLPKSKENQANWMTAMETASPFPITLPRSWRRVYDRGCRNSGRISDPSGIHGGNTERSRSWRSRRACCGSSRIPSPATRTCFSPGTPIPSTRTGANI